jgi:glycyl-tRNA synthetase
VGRLRSSLLEQSNRYDVVDAVLAAQRTNPAGVNRALKELNAWVSRPDWSTILPAFARCVRITRDLPERYLVNPDSLAEPAEIELYQALKKAESAPRKPGSPDDFLYSFLPVIPVINRFFTAVLVMAEDSAVRGNRLGLLQRVAALSQGVADLSLFEGF